MDKKKLRYAILNELNTGNKDLRADTFGVTEEEFLNQVSFLDREGYITKPLYGDNIVYSMALVHLNEKGEIFLEENSTWSNLYKTDKELKD